MTVGSDPVILAYSSSLISLDFLTSVDNNLLTLMDLLIYTDVRSESVPLGHLISGLPDQQEKKYNIQTNEYFY